MAFQKGNKASPGGKKGNKGGGRPPDEFKKKCQELANSPRMLKWLHDIVEGVLPVDPDVRLKAWDRLCDRGYGKAPQAIEHSGTIDMNAEAAKKEIETGVNTYLEGFFHAKS